MWCNLIKTFERTLVLNSRRIFPKNANIKKYHYLGSQQTRFLFRSAILPNTETAQAAPTGNKEFGGEYIIPYNTENEKPENARKLIKVLRTKFRLTEEDAEYIMQDELVSKSYREKSLVETLEILYSENVTKQQFIEQPWLITLDKKKLLEKINILKTLNGYQDLNDFVPLLRLQVPRLRKLVYSLNGESNFVEYGNRVHFIANKLKVPASTVTKYLSKRLFVLEMPLNMFKKNLQNMIYYNVEPMSILKDLWGFRYAPPSVELRLKRASQAKKDKIMPWMVRCPEPILQKSLQISLDEQKILGDKTLAEYVGERLGFNTEEAQVIMNRHPQVKAVRVTKIKEVLDYLLDEEQFTRHEVAQVPRILCHSLKTTKERLEELKRYGCRPSSLVIVCRSKREYAKFLEQWCHSYDQNKNAEKREAREEEAS